MDETRAAETTKDVAETGQVSQDAAEVYEELFVPALFEPWAKRVAKAAGVGPGQDVLDVGCGTGVLTREAARRAWPGASVTGLDLNPGMLAVARRKEPKITWKEGRAEELPFPDEAFDAVVCQFSLMFFEHRTQAIEEMWRVLRPGGRLAVAVWDSLEHAPGYQELARFLEETLGEEAAQGLRVSFGLGDEAGLTDLFDQAGIPDAQLATLDGRARFPSLEAFFRAEVKGWTLADEVSEERYQELLAQAGQRLARFVEEDGTVGFPLPAHIVTADKA